MRLDENGLQYLRYLKSTNPALYERVSMQVRANQNTGMAGLGEFVLSDFLNTLTTKAPDIANSVSSYNANAQAIKNQQAANQLAFQQQQLDQTKAGFSFANAQGLIGGAGKLLLPLLAIGAFLYFQKNKKRR